MPEIAFSGLKKDEERDLILSLLMMVVGEQGSITLESVDNESLLEYVIDYEVSDDSSVTLRLGKAE